ncbi:phytoene/squalene synthase family protein [Sphingomonas xanthus]|uniref:Phytoene/squalene synthase family protein n=1 Tax=Sphingomonas xanthus TaxID=2594473 RepID=A0A516IP74_9SPHN|nr:phytoene/squalene synthase family protein [Sphingomonas xanthus]QDP18711.1 phytoene/squalene synthase family protein [Sphingomonas xanthus]
MNRAAIVAGAKEAIQRGSKSFRAASSLFDERTRERAWLLYCWCRYCDDVADGQHFGFGSGERGSVVLLRSRSRLAAEGQPGDGIAFQSLAQLTSECPLPTRLIEDHLEGFTLDEQEWRPRTEADLARYCYHVAGSVGCMMAIIMGVNDQDSETLDRAADLGIAFQLSNIARDIGEDAANGRSYLPADWLAEAGIEPSNIMAPEHRSALATMTARLVSMAKHYEASARLGVDTLPFRSRLAVLTALRIYGAIGRRVAALGADAWDQRVTIGKMRKLSFLLPSFVEAMIGGLRPRDRSGPIPGRFGKAGPRT